MTVPTLHRAAGAALTAGGLAWTISYWLRDAAGDAVSGAVVTAGILFGIGGVLLTMLGLPAWYAVQAHRAGWPMLVSFVVLFTGLPVLEVASGYFAAALAGLDLPADASPESATGLATGLFIYGLAGTNLGLVAFGICTAVAGVLPRGAAGMVAAGPLLMFVPLELPFGEAIALSVGFLGISWIGLALAVGRAAPQEAPAPASAMV